MFEPALKMEFRSGAPHRFSIVADKYQTYDEPRLHTLYVDKRLGR